MREKGFYWVRYSSISEWQVMEWIGDCFAEICSEFAFYTDSELLEINENRIKSPIEL